MVLTDLSNLAVDVNVDEAEIGQIQVGETVQMTLDAVSGTTLTGKVQRIAQTADTSSSVITYVVHVVLDPYQAALKPGMTVNTTFLVKDLPNVVRVPNEYLRTNRTTNQTTVNVIGASGITAVPVELGVQGTDYSEVTNGLNEGDRIILITNSTATTGSNG